MSIKEFCQKAGITEEQFYGPVTVGGSLDLRGTQITSLPENLTVGGYLAFLLIGSSPMLSAK